MLLAVADVVALVLAEAVATVPLTTAIRAIASAICLGLRHQPATNGVDQSADQGRFPALRV